MSCAILISALKDPRLTRTDLAVLGILLSDVSGMSRKAVAEAAGCAASSVPRSARKLESLGYVERVIDDRTHGGRAKPTGYRIKADTHPNGYVPAPTRGDLDTLELASSAHPKPQKVVSRIGLDTSEIPPKENNQTPLELNPERGEPFEPASVARDAAKVLNGKARTMTASQLAAVIVEKVNSPWLDPHKSLGLNTSEARIHAWMRDLDADFDLDILPTVRSIMARRKSAVSNWRYFDNAISEAVANRIAAEAPILKLTGPSNDQSTRADFTSNVRTPKVNASTAILLAQMQGGDRPRR